MLSHLAGDMRRYNVPIFQFNSKHCVGQRLGNDTVHFDVIFFCQGFFAWLSWINAALSHRSIGRQYAIVQGSRGGHGFHRALA